MKTKKVLIEACDNCGTPAYTVVVSGKEKVPMWTECTSGHGLHGGGPCCSPLDVQVLFEEEEA